MKENKLVELSMDFAIKIIKLCETIKGHYSLVNHWSVLPPQLVQISMRQIMHTESLTLLPNCKLP